MSSAIQGARYRYFEGGFVRVACLAADFATGEPMVVYQAETNGQFWVRPRDSFEAKVIYENSLVDRFRRLDELDEPDDADDDGSRRRAKSMAAQAGAKSTKSDEKPAARARVTPAKSKPPLPPSHRKRASAPAPAARSKRRK